MEVVVVVWCSCLIVIWMEFEVCLNGRESQRGLAVTEENSFMFEWRGFYFILFFVWMWEGAVWVIFKKKIVFFFNYVLKLINLDNKVTCLEDDSNKNFHLRDLCDKIKCYRQQKMVSNITP